MLLIDRVKFKALPKEVRDYILDSCKLSNKVYQSLEEGLIKDEHNIEGSLKELNDKYEDMFELLKSTEPDITQDSSDFLTKPNK